MTAEQEAHTTGTASSEHLVRAGCCMHNACMPNIQIRDVPVDVHEALVRKAELAGQSLQQYLSAQLAVWAAMPTVDEVLDRIERRRKGRVTVASAVEAVHDERART